MRKLLLLLVGAAAPRRSSSSRARHQALPGHAPDVRHRASRPSALSGIGPEDPRARPVAAGSVARHRGGRRGRRRRGPGAGAGARTGAGSPCGRSRRGQCSKSGSQLAGSSVSPTSQVSEHSSARAISGSLPTSRPGAVLEAGERLVRGRRRPIRRSRPTTSFWVSPSSRRRIRSRSLTTRWRCAPELVVRRRAGGVTSQPSSSGSRHVGERVDGVAARS